MVTSKPISLLEPRDRRVEAARRRNLECEDLPDDDELPGDGERDLMAALDAVRAEEDDM